MTNSNIAIEIETAEYQNAPTFRAMLYSMNDDDILSEIVDIAECPDLATLRKVVTSNNAITHFISRGDWAKRCVRGDWSDALRVLKTKLYQIAHDAGADVRKNMKPLDLIAAHADVVARDVENKRLHDEREAASELRTRQQDHRADARLDFDYWAEGVNGDRDSSLRPLYRAMMKARRTCDEWAVDLATHIEKLTEQPVYALGWSGAFVEQASKYEIARQMVDWFEAGVDHDDMIKHALREMVQRSKRASSRSTSVMSNFTDDCDRAAWTEMYELLSGSSLF